MTSLSTILGALPIALAWGAGSESRVSMGISVIGGLIFSGFLTLYIVPAIYSYFSFETKMAKGYEFVPSSLTHENSPEKATTIQKE